ncbi:biotin/lipoyl-binding protein [Neisseria musculi]|nr:biotin/lipoyl-binding protein [Neisseria musculi]
MLLLIYSSICIFIFKVFRIPLNKWTVPTAILGGVVMLTGMLLVMNYNHPYTRAGSQYYISTPIIPNIRGRVVEVADIKPNQLVKKGDVLFKIDPTPYQAAVDLRKAELADAESSIKTIDSDYQSAKARVEEAKLTMARCK